MMFALYTSDFGKPGYVSLADLQALKDEVVAKAENSGCEGCYVEVARWNESKKRWERFAFEKFFGGETEPGVLDPQDESESCWDAAERFAAAITNRYDPIIHRLPTWGDN